MSTPENEPPWERQLLEKVAFAALREQRAKRRWGIFFKLAGLSYLVAVLVMVVDWGGSEQLADARHTAVVHLHGTIEAQGEASAQNINDALEEAFADKRTAGVILRVNSPGGSPVQAGIVHDEIRRLRTKHPQIPLYAVVEDVCASGGYYIAAAADKIFVDKASIVGSIGVLMDAFGFTGAMEKLGIERRLLTAGDNKGFLDPFSPQDAKQKAHAQVLLREIHEQFIDVVRRGRGDRLKDTPELFSGLMWTGSQSVGLGLADGFGTVGSVARDVIKADRIVEFTIKENIAERFARRFRADSTDGVAGSLLGAGRLLFR
ncbi:S49 family peptidase [Accumulibacter sp.]|uniref:S49 family peptidase n=1 Tax=Candidatus Accumulibacter proximus TaxID=2954385 RepID=A0A935PWX3_9PROT|nr:S49 family peptidase [Accumulibacter sp.]MBK7673571.1 S49 family peptidase [Candidatus Accumulibacter proximus]MBL8373901.1 S49 family peptidase [Accumulibacter sp.]